MRSALESRAWHAGLALCAGGLPALAFPAPALWWLAYAALVPWLLLARSAATGRRAALTGWLGGSGFMLAVHHWLLPSLHVFLLVLAPLLGLLWAPWGWLVRRLLGGRPGPGRVTLAVLLLPSGWLMVELVRSWQYLGGPWGLLGTSQWQVGPALRLASVGGVWLVSWVLVAVNAALAALVLASAEAASPAVPAAVSAIRTRRRAGHPRTGRQASGSPAGRATAVFRTFWCGPPGLGAALTATALTAVVALAGVALAMAAASTWSPRPRPEGQRRIAVVQPGQIADPSDRFDRSEALTRRLAGKQPDLVVWGESSVGFDLATHPDLQRRLAALSARVGAELLVNVDARRADRPGIFKSSMLVGPHGPTGERYDKQRLVPFGEYVPARAVLGWATSVGRAAAEDRRRGAGPVMMKAAGVRFGPLVCFETAFPDMSRQLAAADGRLLVAQSSTFTFQHSWAPLQHASLAALRAAETGRSMVHATLTGVSAVYGPRGEPVGRRLGTEHDGARVYPVPLASGTTPYVRLGDWIVHASLAALLAYAAGEAVRARGGGGPRERTRTGRAQAGAPTPARR